MNLTQKIDEDLKAAMKAREELKLSTLRLLKAAISNVAIQKGKPALEDAEVLEAIVKLLKQREESVAAFTKGGRPEMAEKEQKEAGILKAYLPPGLSDEELKGIIQAAIRETQAAGPQALGAVMKAVMPKVAGRADGSKISQFVKEALSP